MKRTVTLLAALIIVIGSAAANGNENGKSADSAKKTVKKSTEISKNLEVAVLQQADSYRLIATNNKSRGFFVKIYNDENKLIHSEYQSRGFSRKYDLSALSSSHYTFKVVSGGESQQIQVD